MKKVEGKHLTHVIESEKIMEKMFLVEVKFKVF